MRCKEFKDGHQCELEAGHEGEHMKLIESGIVQGVFRWTSLPSPLEIRASIVHKIRDMSYRAKTATARHALAKAADEIERDGKV